MRRQTYSKWGIIISIILVIITVLSVFIFYPNHYVLSLQKQRTGQLLAYLPVKENTTFQIQYTHSVHLSGVSEYYQAKGNSLQPTKLVYEDTAIGMPSDAHGDDVFKMEDGKYIIEKSEHAKPFDELNLSVGQVRADHQIIYQNQSYLLKEFVGAGTDVIIDAKRLNRWQLWKGVSMLE
ncbi:DUF1850 domain-containing protein [Pontibacillus salicampi]|uniref:DUF1850 domain-containing protein n=1 Tax=Pontibacillus salicampi TaxID=1449801 RepID=A0ABV6LQQ6_9BACI